MIQPERVNANNGAFGYCSNIYGGVFWGQNFGYSWTPTNPRDWAPNQYKGECPWNQPVTGLSKFPTGNQQAHSIMCGQGPIAGNAFPPNASCHLVPFNGLNGVNGNNPANISDWDFGFNKAECSQNEFVAGISQSTSGRTDGLLCCPSTLHFGCTTQPLDSTNISVDWDWGYFKAECAQGAYLSGVSVGASSPWAPHAIHCCTP